MDTPSATLSIFFIFLVFMLIFYPIVPIISLLILLWIGPQDGQEEKQQKTSLDVGFLSLTARGITGGVASPLQLIFQVSHFLHF